MSRIWPWCRSNLFYSIKSTVLSLLLLFLIVSIGKTFFQWTVFDAVWFGDGDTCRQFSNGACWPFITSRFGQFVYGTYPRDELWRVAVVFLAFIGMLGALALPISRNIKFGITLFFCLPFPIISWFILRGSVFGLSSVPTTYWGGFMMTLIVSVVGITMSLPLSVLLALGRQSNMPIIRSVCVVFIEFWRGIPLITVLFVAAYILGLFFPRGLNLDLLLRAMIAVVVFSAAYLAEVIRGGLQSLPKGQYEASKALGLSYWKMTIFIILPQALKVSIPGLVNSFISLFKDTTLLLIISIIDFLAAIHAGTQDPNWSAPTTAFTGYIFAALVYWVFCFSMSLYSQRLEKRLSTDHSRH